MGNMIENSVDDIVQNILQDYQSDRAIDKIDLFHQPDKEAVIDIVRKLIQIIFPGYYRDKAYRSYRAANHLSALIEDVMYRMNKQIAIALEFKPEAAAQEKPAQQAVNEEAETITVAFFEQLPTIREYLETDLQAAYEGDPAAYYKDEIILSYPGMFAITVNRIAHELYLLSVPLIPRIMTEYAHSITGIDIHPGATIGKYFFIDHGTGIVIGESTKIGEHVKIYQGVTLGALSTRGGQRLKSLKRHPTIEDNVTIYSGASILGGDTVIGRNTVIGSNAFITKSIAEGTRVSIRNQELQFKYDTKTILKKNDLEQDEFWSYSI